MAEDIIVVNNVSKVYKIYDKPIDRLKESLSLSNKKYHKDFYALKDISFDIKKGENVGIIGKNGSGKSTLLKIITGILQSTEGKVNVYGRVSAILELGAGFNPEYTGVENVYNNGIILGFTRKEMNEKLQDIIEFADLGDFINQPVKTYSSGMYARLAFSVAINVNPDILIVDEALSVGDMGFQHKCMNKMKELIEQGVSIIFVSHDTFAVKSLCNRCIYLENGKVKADGNSTQVTDQYLMDTRKKIYNNEAQEILEINSKIEKGIELAKEEKTCEVENKIFDNLRYGTGDILIKNVKMVNEKNEISDHFYFGEIMKIVISAECYKEVNNLNCCIRIRDKNGIDITGTTTFDEKINYPKLNQGDRFTIMFEAPNFLKHDMTFSLGVTINDTKSLTNQIILDHIDLAYTFKSVYNVERPVWYMYYQNFDISFNLSSDK